MNRLFTTIQLAKMAGISRKAMVRLLEKYGIRCMWDGRKRLVPLSELAEKMPDLFLSDRYARLFERLAEADAGSKQYPEPLTATDGTMASL